ncbi:MAG TPA: LytTR family DNA-binding domain-containing protein, partial [Gemmatimonadales bacterium]|nr:LytTR family DNA-binding domain-containing protein [Gemmatimonadales bacterium]
LAEHRPATHRQPAPPSERLVIRQAGRLSFLEIEQVDWFESAGNYVRVHSGGRAWLLRTTMDRLAARLAAQGTFIRVRRSALLSVRAIATLERYGKGTYLVRLRDGTEVVSSRYYQRALQQLLRA